MKLVNTGEAGDVPYSLLEILASMLSACACASQLSAHQAGPELATRQPIYRSLAMLPSGVVYIRASGLLMTLVDCAERM